MAEIPKLRTPIQEGDPGLTEQLLSVCALAAQEAGGFLVPHPEDHAIVVVFEGHQVVISVEQRRH